MSCLDYNDTWESMNQLEQSFNRISTVQDLINVLQNAVNNDNIAIFSPFWLIPFSFFYIVIF